MKWKYYPLGEVCDVIAGGTPKRGNASYWNGSVPWVKISDMLQGVVLSTEECITTEGLKKSAAKLLPAGTTLISIFATIGRTATLGIEATTNQAIVGVIPKDRESFHVPFLRYCLEDRAQYLKSLSRGVAQANINGSVLKKTEIPLPPLSEQKRIAGILDAADALRAKRRDALAQLDTLLQATFLDMFGHPANNPKGWQEQRLGILATNEDGQRIPVKKDDREKVDGEFPYYGASGIIDYVDDFIFEGSRLLVGEDGANLVARSTPIAFIAKGRYWVNNHAHVLADNGKADLLYLEAVINSIDLKPYLSGTAQPKLNQKKLNGILVPCPPLDLQRRFAGIVEAVEQQKARQRSHLAELDALFASLQARAFNGTL